METKIEFFNNPTHSTPAIHPKALQNMIGVDRVNYVGFFRSFLPPLLPHLEPYSTIDLPGNILGFPYSAPWASPLLPRQTRKMSQSGTLRSVLPRRIHQPHCQPGWAGGRAVTGYIGVFGDCTGFRFEKPRPGNPYRAWAAGSYRGFRGFISTTGNFFKIDHPYRLDQSGSQEKIFQRPKKTIKTPKTPFSQFNRGLLPRPG
jgi:hypothetical protein